MYYASKRKELAGLSSSLQSEIPQLYFDVDRDKVKMLGVPLADVFSTMKAYTGSVYVNDFNMFNRIYKVYIQAEAPYREHKDNINLFFVKASNGAMVPLTSLGNASYTTGPGSIKRFNMFTTAVIRGAAAQGYSSGQAMEIDPIVHQVDGKTASQVVWLDALLTNVDRTIKNTNMLIWHKELWLIDHGASLYFHHSWTNWQKQALVPFVQIKDHVLLPFADKLEEVDIEFRQILTSDKIREIVNAIPDDWLNWTEGTETPQDLRDIYIRFLEERMKHSETFVNEAQNARKALI